MNRLVQNINVGIIMHIAVENIILPVILHIEICNIYMKHVKSKKRIKQQDFANS